MHSEDAKITDLVEEHIQTKQKKKKKKEEGVDLLSRPLKFVFCNFFL